MVLKYMHRYQPGGKPVLLPCSNPFLFETLNNRAMALWQTRHTEEALEMNMNLNALEHKHVVLADDDQDHAFFFERILKQVNPNHQLTIVNDGALLLPQLLASPPDLLFLDLIMPSKNGIECLKEIRQTPGLRHLPVVVYSASSKMTDIQRSYLHHADLYMVKPFNTEHLHNALQSVLTMDLRHTSNIRNHYFINNRFVPFTAMGM